MRVSATAAWRSVMRTSAPLFGLCLLGAVLAYLFLVVA